MSTTTQERSAQVFQFPPRGRFAASAQQTSTNMEALPIVNAPRISYGSWYHDEAIEAERQRSN